MALPVYRQFLREQISDLVGVRTGLAVGTDHIDPIINSTFPEIGPLSGDGMMMQRFDHSYLIASALDRFGDPWASWGHTPVLKAYFDLPEGVRDRWTRVVLNEIHHQVHIDNANSEGHLYECELAKEDSPYASLDLFVHRARLFTLNDSALLDRIQDKIGPEGLLAGRTLLFAVRARQRIDPWFAIEPMPTDSVISLDDLFRSGRSKNSQSRFFEPQFVNYLARNLDQIPSIHWRQLERLTAEFFDRQGYYVELGPGRNDGGVDLRIWPQSPSDEQPPLMIVQCKRHRAKIGKAVVKALWADAQAERAHKGIIVATSSLEPGARKVIEARRYAIDVVDGNQVAQWIMALRTPGTGVDIL